jgi:hypothetical protein
MEIKVFHLGEVSKLSVPLGICAASAKLHNDPTRYFDYPPDTLTLPLEDLIYSHFEPSAVRNAISRMAEAFRGERLRRSPVTVTRFSPDAYLVLDGNSTAVVAAAAGWKTVPCQIVTSCVPGSA